MLWRRDCVMTSQCRSEIWSLNTCSTITTLFLRSRPLMALFKGLFTQHTYFGLWYRVPLKRNYNSSEKWLIPDLDKEYIQIWNILSLQRSGKLPTSISYICIGRQVLYSCGSAGKESACNVGDLGLTPGLGRPPGEGKGYTLQYSGLENSMDSTVHWITKSRTRLSNLHLHFFFTTSATWEAQRLLGMC